MAVFKYNFTDEERKRYKNLNVSANIYQQQIRKLEAILETETDEGKRALIQSKIVDKINKRQAKLDQVEALRESVAKVTVMRKVTEPVADEAGDCEAPIPDCEVQAEM